MTIVKKVEYKLDYFLHKTCYRIRKNKEKRFLSKLRKKNHQEHVSIICNNCVGGVIYHNLGLRFDSPTINLFIKGEEYLAFCKDLYYYSCCQMVESIDSMKNGYPVGVLLPKDDQHIPVSIYFQHYKSFEQAKEKWDERFSRVDYKNLFWILEFYDTIYKPDLMYEFDKLPYENKMIITHKRFPDLRNASCVSCYKEDKPRGRILEYKGITGKRYLDEIDYVGFINGKMGFIE